MPDTEPDPFETLGRAALATLDAEDQLAPLAMDEQLLRRDLRARLFGDGESVWIGRYEVVRRAGRGGMGTVYLARDHELERNVAVKLLRPDRVAGGERMLLEARALARLTHPNVVTVHEVGRHGERVFIAMEWVEGRTLRAWLQQAAPAAAEIGRVLAQVARGLDAAHRAGLVHRDVKPDNVLLGNDGRVRVVDFGVAKATAADEQPSTGAAPRSGHGALTQTGAWLGTPAYMAAEQFLGEATDARTDVFALCVMMYEAFTAARPFDGDDPAALAYAVLHAQPRAPSAAAMPASLAALVMRGLQRRASERPSLAALAEALDAVANPLRRRGRAWLGAAVLATGGVGLSIARWLGPSEPPPAAAPSAAITAVIAAADDDDRLALAEAFVRDFPDAATAERAIALATVGDVHWRRSCVGANDGLCVDFAPLDRGTTAATCAPRLRGAVTVRARERVSAELAREHLRGAVAMAGADAGDDPSLRAAFAEALARARTQLADGELESYLGIVPPPDLDFAGAPTLSSSAAEAFLRRLVRDGERLVLDYAAVKPHGDPRWILVAAQRTGMVFETPAVSFASLPATDAGDCAEIAADGIAPTLRSALSAYEFCLSYADEHGLESEAVVATCRARRLALGGA